MYEYIMQKEKLLNNLGINFSIDLTNWQTIFNSIEHNEKFAIIECEQAWINRFLLGKLTKAKKKKIEILYLEAKGIFEEYVTEQKYKEITIVRFDEIYINCLCRREIGYHFHHTTVKTLRSRNQGST